MCWPHKPVVLRVRAMGLVVGSCAMTESVPPVNRFGESTNFIISARDAVVLPVLTRGVNAAVSRSSKFLLNGRRPGSKPRLSRETGRLLTITGHAAATMVNSVEHP